MILKLWITPRIYPRFILILFYRSLDKNLADLMIKGPDHLGNFGRFLGVLDFFKGPPPQCVQSAYFVAWRLLSVLKIELPNLLRF